MGLFSAAYPVELGDSGFTLQTCNRRAPKFAPSQSLPDVDFAGFARGLGLDGVTIDDPDEFGLWDRVLNGNRPAVLDIRCHPDVLPPDVRHLRGADILAGAVTHGDENDWDSSSRA